MTTLAKILLLWPAVSVVAAAGWSALYRWLGACEPGDDVDTTWSDERFDDAFMALVSELEWHQS